MEGTNLIFVKYKMEFELNTVLPVRCLLSFFKENKVPEKEKHGTVKD